MKMNEKMVKRAIAILLSVVLLGSGIATLPEHQADAAEATKKQTYEAWQDVVPVNGSFEVGEPGMDVYGWKLVNSDYAFNNKNTEVAYVENGNLTLKTVVDPNTGNKVAEFKKNKDGHAYMSSQPIKVEPNTDYRFTLDYLVKELYYVNEGADSYYIGAFFIESYDELGNSISRDNWFMNTSDQNKPFIKVDGWQSFLQSFRTPENCDHIVINCWRGGDYRQRSTVWYDNIRLEKDELYEIPNASFDKVTYQAQGAKAESTAGPAGWTLYRVDWSEEKVITSLETAYTVTAEPKDGRKVAAIRHTSGKTDDEKSQKAVLQSDYIAIPGGAVCDVNAEALLECYNENGMIDLSKGLFRGIGLHLSYYDTEQKLLDTQQLAYTSTNGNKDGYLKSGSGTRQLDTGGEWRKFLFPGQQAPNNAAYVKVGFYLGYHKNDTEYNPASFALFIDSIDLNVKNSSAGYREVYGALGPGVSPDGGNQNFKNYSIRRVKEERGYEDAVEVYMAHSFNREGRAIVYTSQPMSVSAGTSYKLKMDVKIKGVEDNTSFVPGDVAVRYKNGDTYLNESKYAYIHRFYNNQDWTKHDFTITPPDTATAVEIAFVIGHAYGADTSKNHGISCSYANIALEEESNNVFWANYDKTDLLFVQLENIETADVKELVKSKIRSKSTEDLDFTYDANKNGHVNEDDLMLMRWKITGVQNSSEVRWW